MDEELTNLKIASATSSKSGLFSQTTFNRPQAVLFKFKYERN
jgi:hypothetical protein